MFDPLKIVADAVCETLGVSILYITGDYTFPCHAVSSTKATEAQASSQYKQLDVRHVYDRPTVSRPDVDWIVRRSELPIQPTKGDIIQTESGEKYQVAPDNSGESFRYDDDSKRFRYRIHTKRISE